MDQLNAAVQENQEYSEAELQDSETAMFVVGAQLLRFLSSYVAIQGVPRLEVPTYFVQGKYDMNTPPSLAKEYFNLLAAPKGKTWIDFEDSAHFPMYEEHEAFLKVLRKAL